MRLRRSNSTASDTRPATRRRATVRTSRNRPAARMARATSFRPERSPSWIWVIARPVSQGMATVPATDSAASPSDQKTPVRYGRRKPSSRKKVFTLHKV